MDVFERTGRKDCVTVGMIQEIGDETGMENYRAVKEKNQVYPLGVTAVEDGAHFSVVSGSEACALILFARGKKKPLAKLNFPEEDRLGNVWNMTVTGDFTNVEYCFEIDGKMESDPYGHEFSGRESWGNLHQSSKVLRASVLLEDYDWEGDKPLEYPYEDCVIYRIHPRGFTKHSSSKVENRGCLAGIAEKIPYLQELGITTVELMPATEFQEVMMPEGARKNPYEKYEPTGKLNYWGFVPGQRMAPKASYCSGSSKHPVREMKDLVKALHKAGIELVIDLFFTGLEEPCYVLDTIRFWAREYHIDGVHIVGYAPEDLLARDPYLSNIKIWVDRWSQVQIPAGGKKRLAEYNDSFETDMRRLLKGDEDQINNLVFHSKHNPKEYGTINYMANVNGFTLMDMVSYEQKHNEANGENNSDGPDYNYSWNCGVEGPSRKKKVMEMRKKQLRNAVLMLFLSQGTPLLMAGDEFGRTKGGNNNSYCQDNETSWLNWNLLKTNRELFEFVKYMIQFRKKHRVFHMEQEPKVMDYLGCGDPDISFHGVKAWCPEFENFRRQLGIMYCGSYAVNEDGTNDNSFFVAYNMHWEPHEFSLPNLPKGQKWHVAINTDEGSINGIYADGEELLLEKQKQFMVPARSIVVFIGK